MHRKLHVLLHAPAPHTTDDLSDDDDDDDDGDSFLYININTEASLLRTCVTVVSVVIIVCTY